LIETRVKEPHLSVYPEKSTVAENIINLGHRIQLFNTKKSRHMDRIIRETIEIELTLL
jgi:hypothetical protein